MTEGIRIQFVVIPVYTTLAETLDREWNLVRPQVANAAGDKFARTVDGIVRASKELLERPSTNPNARSDRLFSFASGLFTSSDVLGAPDLSKDHEERDAAAQTIIRLGIALLDIRAAIGEVQHELNRGRTS